MTESKKNNSFERLIQRAIDFYEYSKEISDYCPLFPDHVHIEPTNACNLRCVHCHQSMRGSFFTKKIGLMDINLYKKVIDDIRGVSSRITLNQQGEPLLHSQIVEMVRYAKDAGLSVSLLTNATKLTTELSQQLLDADLDRIVFSFEGSSCEIHEKIRVRSSYQRTLGNILHFIRLNYERGQKTFICMSMVDTSYCHDDIDNYKTFFEALPINTIFVNPQLTMSGASLTADEIDMNQYTDIPADKIPTCRLPWESIVVNWDGLVSPCAVDYNESHIIGDANTDSLINIFNNDKMRKFRRCHIEKDYDWIEKQGALCVPCNCRFSLEYDMGDLKNYVVNYIVRQSKVFATHLHSENPKSDHQELDSKYRYLLKKITELEN